MNTVRVKNLEIGRGRPKICAPVAEKTEEEILRFAERLAVLPVDLAEWRIDWYKDVLNRPALRGTMRLLSEKLGNIPLLVTLRTKQEGGSLYISPEEYISLNQAILSWNLADMLDIELSAGETAVTELLRDAGKVGIKTIVSSHDFQKTPPREEMVYKLLKMKELGADLPKLAVMPQNTGDLLSLLSATEEAVRRGAGPVVTMAMGGLGLVSRLAGEVFGSALTFGSAGKASAPGQVEISELDRILTLQHESLQNESDQAGSIADD